MRTAEVTSPPSGPLRIIFGGDTSFGESYQEAIARRGSTNILLTKSYPYCLKNFAAFLHEADQVVVNLETVLTDLPLSPLAGQKSYLHRSDAIKTPEVLHAHNIKVVSLANNHAVDYGIEGLHHSLAALKKQNITWLGAGRDEASAFRPVCFDYQLESQPFQIVIAAGFAYRKTYDDTFRFYAKGDAGGVNAWTRERAARHIQALRCTYPEAFLVAFPHFGRNYAWKTKRQTQLAQALIDAGANLVLGHGAHMLQEIECYRGSWIVYSLGNFVFNSPGRYALKQAPPYSLVARLDVAVQRGTIKPVLRLYPIFSDNRITNFQPHFVSDDQFQKIKALLVQRSPQSEALKANMNTGQDRFGFYLLLDTHGRPPELGVQIS